jgi:hypothetical protein
MRPPSPSPDARNEKPTIQKSELETSLHERTPHISTENINVKLANPLAGLSHEQLMIDGEKFAKLHGLGHLSELIQKGALVAQDPLAFNDLPLLTVEEKEALRHEITHKWSQPKMLYYLVILCSGK